MFVCRFDTAFAVVNVHFHTFYQVFDTVEGHNVGVYTRGSQKPRAVAVDHSAKVKGAGFNQTFHLVAKQIDKSPRVRSASPDCLVGKGDCSVKVFKPRLKLDEFVI